MKKQLCIVATLLMATVFNLNAQVGIGTTTPHASAQLDVTSTTKGVLVTRMNAAQRGAILSPAEGLMVYQTDAPAGLWMYISGAWVRLASVNDVPANTFGQASAYAGNNTTSIIAVVLGGTPVPLPSNQNLGSNVTVNGANTIFTVGATGRYRIFYRLNSTASLLVNSTVTVNGVASPPLTVSPVVSVASHTAEAIISLNAGDQLSLEYFGLLGAATLLGNGQGAALVIQRIQ